jgi:purine-binding chemotaxis protein CheW
MTEQLLLFAVDQLSLAIPVDRIEEVLRRHPTTKVPLAPSGVGGLVNLRGSIVMAVDLRDRLVCPPPDPDTQPMHIVARSGNDIFSLLVDRIDDVHIVERSSRAPIPERLSPTVRAYTVGVYPFPDRLVLELDVDRLFEA